MDAVASGLRVELIHSLAAQVRLCWAFETDGRAEKNEINPGIGKEFFITQPIEAVAGWHLVHRASFNKRLGAVRGENGGVAGDDHFAGQAAA